MTDKIDLQKYSNFVEAVTSSTSNNTELLANRLNELSGKHGLNISLAITSYTGQSGEAGEFSEIFKKVIFHGKEYTEETKEHAKKELGDIIFYWINACRAIGVDPNDVISENIKKLENRYPGGVFNPDRANNRSQGDI